MAFPRECDFYGTARPGAREPVLSGTWHHFAGMRKRFARVPPTKKWRRPLSMSWSPSLRHREPKAKQSRAANNRLDCFVGFASSQ
jgi:hypothetical protein